MDGKIAITIPVGIIADPLTGSEWEHTGVTPDIFCETDHALDLALEMLKEKFQER